MPEFQCTVCGTMFPIPDETLAKYPNWRPKYCRDHKPQSQGGGGGGRIPSADARRGPATGMAYRDRAVARNRAARDRAPRGRSATVEENLTVAEVLARYTKGPDHGVFTDGACSPNPGPGGWGMVHVESGEIVTQLHGHAPDTTNNRMELTAIIEALKVLPVDAKVDVYSDSKLCIQTLDEWAAGWERNGWRRREGPVKNLDLVQEAFALRRARPGVRLKHIRAHDGNRWNEYADSLATAWQRDTL